MSAELRGAALLVVGGAALLLVASAGDWARGVVEAAPPLPASEVTAEAPGSVRALGLVVLAAAPALFATRRTGRVVIGVLLVLAGAAAVAVAVAAMTDATLGLPQGAEGSATARPLLAVAGGVDTAVAGVLVAVRDRRWPVLGRRYDAPAARPATRRDEAPGLWDALDRGEDPTR